MSEYLDEVLEAVEHAMDGVWARALVAERLYAHADSIRDDNYWTSYYTWRDANKIQDKVDAASFARSALAQAVLQCGKQGLSIVHGPRRNSPEGEWFPRACACGT